MASWSSNPSVLHTGGTFNFPMNTGNTPITYTISYTSDTNCTATTTYTVPTGSTCQTPCESEWKLTYAGGQSSNIGFPLQGPTIYCYCFYVDRLINGTWTHQTNLGTSDILISETCQVPAMTRYSLTVGGMAPNAYAVTLNFDNCNSRGLQTSFSVSIPNICPSVTPLTFSGKYGEVEVPITITLKNGSSLPSTYSIYINFEYGTKCSGDFTCCAKVPCGGNITNTNNKVRVPIDRETSDTTKIKVTGIDIISGPSYCEDPKSMTCTRNDTDGITFSWDTDYC